MSDQKHLEHINQLYALAQHKIKQGAIATQLLDECPHQIIELACATGIPTPLVRAEICRLEERSLIKRVNFETYQIPWNSNRLLNFSIRLCSHPKLRPSVALLALALLN